MVDFFLSRLCSSFESISMNFTENQVGLVADLDILLLFESISMNFTENQCCLVADPEILLFFNFISFSVIFFFFHLSCCMFFSAA